MKHGDKAKSKKASKASGKKSSKAVANSKSAAKSSKAKKQTASKKSDRSGDNGKPRSRISPDFITFTNPVVANAFKRAVKKYPNAFRRLTD